MVLNHQILHCSINISALSVSFATQTSVCAGISEFVTGKRHESFLAHASFPVSEPQKRELLVSPGTDLLLFNQPLLEKIAIQLKEDSLVSSPLSLSKLSRFSGRSKSQPAGQRYSSPLEYARPGFSGSRKRSASPARGYYSKRGRGGRGVSPLVNSRRVSAIRSHVPVH